MHILQAYFITLLMNNVHMSQFYDSQPKKLVFV